MANVQISGGGQGLDVECGFTSIAIAGTRVEVPTGLSRLLYANIQQVNSKHPATFTVQETVDTTSTGTSVGAACGTSIMIDVVPSGGTSMGGTSTALIELMYRFEGRS